MPDYITRVREGGFYGWPWYYIGGHQDPRHPGEHPDVREKVLIPDILLQSHSASLEMTFYTGATFPREYANDAFACEHGSWNRSFRTGYKLVPVSPGGLGGFGAHHHLRQSLVYLNVPTLAQPEAYVGGAANLFHERGELINTATRDFVTKFMTEFAAWVAKLTA